MSDHPPSEPPKPSPSFGSTPPPPPPPPGTPWGGPSYGHPGPPPAAGRQPGELLDRFLARLMDHLIIGVLNALIVSVVIVGTVIGTDGNYYFGYGESILAGLLSAALGTLVGVGYFAYMETKHGRTLGKMVVRLRVEGAAGGNPTLQESVRRNIWMLLPLMGVVPIVGGIFAFFGQLLAAILIAVGISHDTLRRRPWTDKLAGTQVIRER